MAFLVNSQKRRNSKVLVNDNFKYIKNKVTKTNIHWRCWRKTNCSGKVTTNIFDITSDNPDIQINNSTPHNHTDEHDMLYHMELKRSMDDAIERDPTKPIRRVYTDTVTRADTDRVPQFSFVRSSLFRKRASLLPPIPHDIDEVNIEGEWRETWNGDRFFRQKDGNWGNLIFATKANLKILEKCTTVYIDGTFKTCPGPYAQFVTIHGLYRGRVLPFAMCLMSGKTIGHYRQFLAYIKGAVRRATHRDFEPGNIVCDFEQALIIAINTELPTTRKCGCYFHFTQNLWRKIQGLGLSGAYQTVPRLEKILRKFMALGYLPVQLIRNNFRLHSQDARTRRYIARYPELGDFIRYFEGNYINGVFEPRLWNVFRRNSDMRTNNHVEGNCQEILTLGNTANLITSLK